MPRTRRHKRLRSPKYQRKTRSRQKRRFSFMSGSGNSNNNIHNNIINNSNNGSYSEHSYISNNNSSTSYIPPEFQIIPLPSDYVPIQDFIRKFLEEESLEIEEQRSDTIFTIKLKKKDDPMLYGHVRFIPNQMFGSKKAVYIDVVMRDNGKPGTGYILLLQVALWAYTHSFSVITLSAQAGINAKYPEKNVEKLYDYYRSKGFACDMKGECYVGIEYFLKAFLKKQ